MLASKSKKLGYFDNLYICPCLDEFREYDVRKLNKTKK
jgi:hypothetical protein